MIPGWLTVWSGVETPPPLVTVPPGPPPTDAHAATNDAAIATANDLTGRFIFSSSSARCAVLLNGFQN
jgi:hypothetical protein